MLRCTFRNIISTSLLICVGVFNRLMNIKFKILGNFTGLFLIFRFLKKKILEFDVVYDSFFNFSKILKFCFNKVSIQCFYMNYTIFFIILYNFLYLITINYNYTILIQSSTLKLRGVKLTP